MLRHNRSTKMLSRYLPLPSMLTRMPRSCNVWVKASLVNCAPWSVLKTSGRPAGFERAVCHVLLPDGDDLSPLLKRGSNRNGLGPGGYVYEDLRILEATRRLVAEHAEKGDPWIIPGMNRMLVERATHPDALQTLVDELDDDWIVHGHDITGVRLAEGLTARDAVIRRDVSFLDREVAFGSNEERIRTRLGDEGVVVTFEQLPVSPFDPGLEIGRISIPHHMSRGLDPQDAGWRF